MRQVTKIELHNIYGAVTAESIANIGLSTMYGGLLGSLITVSLLPFGWHTPMEYFPFVGLSAGLIVGIAQTSAKESSNHLEATLVNRG